MPTLGNTSITNLSARDLIVENSDCYFTRYEKKSLHLVNLVNGLNMTALSFAWLDVKFNMVVSTRASLLLRKGSMSSIPRTRDATKRHRLCINQSPTHSKAF